jgi:Asp-tRNA(Asn)/Glu-tRNA(Gln) amidotransferase A subunit family amidase
MRILNEKTIAIKDNICIKDEPATCGLKMLDDFVSPYNATVVDKLIAAGFSIAPEPPAIAAEAEYIKLKPTRGAVSRYGLITATPSLEEITPMGKTVDEVAELFNIIRGVDEKDVTTIVGANCVRPQADDIKTGKLPPIKYAKTTYNIIAAAEMFSNYARFDGIRYGYRSDNAETLTELYENTRAEGFDEETKKQIITGAIALSKQYRHLYYDRAVRARAKICEEVNAAFQKCDVIITPIDDNSAIIPNLTGLPAIFVAGKQKKKKKFSEELLFQVAREVGNYV